MASLYELTEDLRHLQELVDSADDLPQQAIDEAFDLIKGELSDKLEAYQAVCAGIAGDVAAIKAEEQRLAERRKALEKRSEQMCARMLEAMRLMGENKVRTARWTFSARKTPGRIVVDDDGSIPMGFLAIKLSPDLKAIKEHLKKVGPLPFARIEADYTLSVS